VSADNEGRPDLLGCVVGALLVSQMVGCDSERHDVAAVCAQIAETHCRKLFTCFTDERVALLGFPVPLEQCISVRVDECRGLTIDTACEDGVMYDPEAAEQCLEQTQELRCDRAGSDDSRQSCLGICNGDGDGDV
jgi:hypothetical protein